MLAWSAAVIITVLASLFFALVAFMTQPQDFSAPGPDWVEPGRGVWAWVELATGVLLTSLALSLLPVRVGRMAFPDHQRAITAFGLATPAIAVGMVWIYVAVQ